MKMYLMLFKFRHREGPRIGFGGEKGVSGEGIWQHKYDADLNQVFGEHFANILRT
jgi:hypothetical protein